MNDKMTGKLRACKTRFATRIAPAPNPSTNSVTPAGSTFSVTINTDAPFRVFRLHKP